MIRDLLLRDFEDVFTSLEDQAPETFQSVAPEVLIFAFSKLAESERQYLALWRSSKDALRPHRVLVLCRTADVRQAYALCKRGIFDDYVQYWPMSLDAMRLPMSVHLAFRALQQSDIQGAPDQRNRTKTELEDGGSTRRDALGSPVASVTQSMVDAAADLELALSRLAIAASTSSPSQRGEERGDGGANGTRDVGTYAELRNDFDSLRNLHEKASRIEKSLSTLLSSIAPGNTTAELRYRTILVVDDDPFQRNVIAAILKNQGCKLLFAANGLKAIEMMEQIKPDVILLDVMMPELDGAETIRRLKALPQFASIPVLMMAGDSRQAIVTTTIGAGAKDFLVKPIVAATLIEKLKRSLAH